MKSVVFWRKSKEPIRFGTPSDFRSQTSSNPYDISRSNTPRSISINLESQLLGSKPARASQSNTQRLDPQTSRRQIIEQETPRTASGTSQGYDSVAISTKTTTENHAGFSMRMSYYETVAVDDAPKRTQLGFSSVGTYRARQETENASLNVDIADKPSVAPISLQTGNKEATFPTTTSATSSNRSEGSEKLFKLLDQIFDTHGSYYDDVLGKATEFRSLAKTASESDIRKTFKKVADWRKTLTKGEEASRLSHREKYSISDSLLHWAVALDNLPVVRTLVSLGCDVNEKFDHEGVTSLQLAVSNGTTQMVMLLLEFCGDLEVSTTPENTSLLELASRRDIGTLAVVNLLVDRRVNVNAANFMGFRPLHVWAMKNDLPVIKYLLDHGAEVDAKSLTGITPLLTAAFDGRENAVRLFIEYGADLESRDEDGRTALWHAVNQNRKNLVWALIELGANFNKRGTDGFSPLDNAIYKGHIEMVELLLECGADTKGTDGGACTSLTHAIRWNKEDSIKLLLDSGVSIAGNGQNDPLGLAVQHGNVQAAKVLLERGADANANCKDGLPPLHIAVDAGDAKMAELLLKYIIDVDDKCTKGFTALYRAADKGHVQIAELLLNNGADHDVRNAQGSSPLHQAVHNSHEDMTRLLLDRGANSDAIDTYGDAPLHKAAGSYDTGVIEILLQHSADIEKPSWKTKASPLLTAARKGREKAIAVLLQNGANRNAIDSDGRTSLHHAILVDKPGILRFLLTHGTGAINLEAKDTVLAETPLLLAARRGCWTMVEMLLDFGANVNATDASGRTALYAAARNGDLAHIHLLLQKDKNIDAKDRDSGVLPVMVAIQKGHKHAAHVLLKIWAIRTAGNTFDKIEDMTPLHHAVLGHNADILQYLLHNPTAIDAIDLEATSTPLVETPLLLAARKGFWPLVKILLDFGANVNATNKNGWTALHFAAAVKDDIASINLLYVNGTDLDPKDTRYGKTPLMVAVEHGHSKAVEVLLELGVDRNAADIEEKTVLHHAVLRNDVNILQAILKAKNDTDVINLEAKDETTAETPLLLATHRGLWGMVDALLQFGANVNATDKHGNTPLHFALHGGDHNLPIVVLFSEHVVDWESKSFEHRESTPLLLAVKFGYHETVEFLLVCGADANTRDVDNQTPLDVAARSGNIIIAKHLLAHGADINSKRSEFENTPLLLATQSRKTNMVELLLNKGADINARGERGNTALHIAIESECLDIAELLIDRGADIQIRNRKFVRPFAFLSKRSQATKDLFGKCKNVTPRVPPSCPLPLIHHEQSVTHHARFIRRIATTSLLPYHP